MALDRLDSTGAYSPSSDGELQGGTWEAAMAAAHCSLDGLFAFIDCNNQQADGPPARVLMLSRFIKSGKRSDGHARIDGNDIAVPVDAIDRAKTVNGNRMRLFWIRNGQGVRARQREKNHSFAWIPASGAPCASSESTAPSDERSSRHVQAQRLGTGNILSSDTVQSKPKRALWER